MYQTNTLTMRNSSRKSPNGIPYDSDPTLDVPEAVDWRSKGAVTPVKNQGHCGSCWAFSSTGAIEGQHFLATGKLVSLSEQNLVDCDKDNDGCRGGLMDAAFDYVKNNKGIDTEESYPYEMNDGQCRFNASSVGATVSGFVRIAKDNEDQLKEAVSTKGPISVAIHGMQSFQDYHKGVYYDKECNSSGLNHAVLVVGYGSEDGHDYWLVKNSWGVTFGEEGYIKMARNKENHCGIASEAIYPLM